VQWYRRSRFLRSFGSPKQLKAFPRNLWLDLVVVVCVVLVLAGGGAAFAHLRANAQNTRDRQWALGLAGDQIRSLRASHGLSLGMQCFDSNNNPRAATEKSAPCSYDPRTRQPGCDTAARSDCAVVQIAPSSSLSAGVDDLTLPLTYSVQVSWGRLGARQQVTLAYQLVQANPAYGSDSVRTGGTSGSGGNGPIGTADGEVGGVGTTTGGTPIHKLADIPGGPGVGVGAAPCQAGAKCDSSTSYDLSGHFLLTTNIPSKLITSCSWGFGDDTPVVTLGVTQVGCNNGEVVQHDYAGIWQMQHLPTYPASCLAPLGSGVDSYVFPVSVTIHTTQGIDVTSLSPHRTQMPACKQ